MNSSVTHSSSETRLRKDMVTLSVKILERGRGEDLFSLESRAQKGDCTPTFRRVIRVNTLKSIARERTDALMGMR